MFSTDETESNGEITLIFSLQGKDIFESIGGLKFEQQPIGAPIKWTIFGISIFYILFIQNFTFFTFVSLLFCSFVLCFN